MSTRIISGDARATGLSDRSVHMIATSPPYWGLRKYDDDPRQIGNEPTPEDYVESMRAVGRECARVLRDDGVMWLNLGDTYSSSGGHTAHGTSASAGNTRSEAWPRGTVAPVQGLPSGNLVGIPWRVAFALQGDGWILRAAIPWVKANCMPESVTNRPTTAHEYVFLFAKSKGYFFDADAVRVGLSPSTHGWTAKTEAPDGDKYSSVGGGHSGKRAESNPAGRNIRTSDFVQTALDEYEAHVARVRAEGGLLLSPEGDPLTFLVNPVAYRGAHFAAWPPRLVAPMILAGTSERGCCPTCGAQWWRRVEKTKGDAEAKDRPKHLQSAKSTLSLSGNGSEEWAQRGSKTLDLGFFPACSCPAHEPIPSIVFDPFGGSGTTAQVADALGRSAVLCELNAAYHSLIRERLATKLDPATLKPAKPARAVKIDAGVKESLSAIDQPKQGMFQW